MSQTIESNKITDIFNYVDDKTLVIFDVDNTLIETVQEFGCYTWSCNMTSRFEKKGIEYFQAMQKTCAIFAKIKDFISFKTVEPEALDVIKKLESDNIKTMALTKRMFSTKQSTIEQLLSVNIEFSKKTIHDKEIKFDDMIGFSEGILYSGLGDNKGECLISFLEKISYTPENIVFVDDGKHHVENVYSNVTAKNIPITCIRYGAADQRVANFNPAKADTELLNIIGNDRYNLIMKELL
ncbi:DUF2608 domain-containing protein [Candidatus Dependentiae bacterium]